MSAWIHETVLNLSAHPLLWGLARMARRAGPIFRVPGLGVVVNDAEYAREIFRRDGDFTKNGPGSFADAITSVMGPTALGNMDGAEHRRLRGSLAAVLAPSRVEQLVTGRSGDTDALCSQLARGDGVDLVRFIRGWSGRIAFDVLGIAPPAGREEEASQNVVRLSERIASVLEFQKLSERQIMQARADCEQLASYFRVAYEKPAPAESLVDRLHELNMSFEQALGLLLIYVIGGTLTISAALPRIVALLVDNGLFALLAEQPEIIQTAIDEGLRMTAPLPGTVRIAQREAHVNGYKLSKHARIVILTCNLARDPKLFPNPDRFDVRRRHSSHAGRLWYGGGPHRCAGFHLAQRELTAVLTALARLGQDLRISKRRPAFGVLLPSYRELIVRPVRLRAA